MLILAFVKSEGKQANNLQGDAEKDRSERSPLLGSEKIPSLEGSLKERLVSCFFLYVAGDLLVGFFILWSCL